MNHTITDLSRIRDKPNPFALSLSKGVACRADFGKPGPNGVVNDGRLNRQIRRLFAATCIAFSPLIAAQDAAESNPFTFSGFGTFGLMQTDKSNVHYGVSGLEDSGVRNRLNTEFGSKLGLQGTYRLHSQFSVTAQVVAQRTENKFEPVAEWLFAKWQPLDFLSIRAGRLGAPIYMVSDYRLVNYANLWVRPPVDLYSQVPFTSFDGLDISSRHTVGAGQLTTQGYYGSTKADGGNGYRTDLKHIIGINLSYEVGPVTLRGGFARTKVNLDTSPYDPIVNGLRGAAAFPGLSALSAVATDYDIKNKLATFASLAAIMDFKNYVFIGEVGQRRFEGQAVPDTTAWALTAGYRIGKVTPYLTYSGVKIDSARTDNRVPPAGPLLPLSAAVNTVLDGAGTRTVGMGARWDFRDNMALKFQVERSRPDSATFTGRFGTMLSAPAGFNDAVRIYSLSLDFVF